MCDCCGEDKPTIRYHLNNICGDCMYLLNNADEMYHRYVNQDKSSKQTFFNLVSIVVQWCAKYHPGTRRRSK